MTYEELKIAYEESLQKCSELEKEIEDKDLRIEHLTELLIKRNRMLFGQKTAATNRKWEIPHIYTNHSALTYALLHRIMIKDVKTEV